MSQRQFESGVDVGESTSADLSHNPFIKQVVLETEILRNPTASSSKGISRLGVKEATAYTLSNCKQPSPEATVGIGIFSGLGGIRRAYGYGPTTNGIMTELWVNSQLDGNSWGGFARSAIETYKSQVGLDSNRRSANRSLSSLQAENTVIMPASAGEFTSGAKVNPKSWNGRAGRHISAEALDLAASLRITGRMDELTANMSEALKAYKDKIDLSNNGQSTAKQDEMEPESREDSTASTTGDGDHRTGEPPTVTAAIREVPTLQVVDNTAPKVSARTEPLNPAPGPAALKPQVAEADCQAESKPSISAAAMPKARLMEIAFQDAHKHSISFENQRAQRQAERDIADIETNRKRFRDSSERQAALEEARERKANADACVKDNSPKYAQTLKKLSEFIRSVEDYARVEPNAAIRDVILRDSVKQLEELMMPIDNIWNGIAGKTADLPRPGVKTPGARPIWPEERLSQIHSHLEAKINTVDGAQAQRVNIVKDNATFREIFRLFDSGKLPKEGSLVFFTSDGCLLYQSELKVSPKAYQSRAKDAASAARHATNTPAFIDVARLQRGHGPEGAGLWRFIGQESRIVGAAVLHPVMRDGKPVELPGARNKHGEAMVKKEVVMVINTVPDGISENMAYGHMLNTMRAKKIALDRSAPTNNSDSQGEGLRQNQRFSPEVSQPETREKTDGKANTPEVRTARMISSEV